MHQATALTHTPPEGLRGWGVCAVIRKTEPSRGSRDDDFDIIVVRWMMPFQRSKLIPTYTTWIAEMRM
ncbi:MAG TPA: hypothetical protein VED16_00800 [Candidatus Acidoferrum sp.]|nr:hypothetical protein [Candidatus Acidoferrum sp.]